MRVFHDGFLEQRHAYAEGHSADQLGARRLGVEHAAHREDTQHPPKTDLGEAVRDTAAQLEQLAKEPRGGMAIPAGLEQDVDDLAVLVDVPPEVLTPASNDHEEFVQRLYLIFTDARDSLYGWLCAGHNDRLRGVSSIRPDVRRCADSIPVDMQGPPTSCGFPRAPVGAIAQGSLGSVFWRFT
jgi:hypothetical protein